MKYIILFNGPPRSGKDTLALELQKHLPKCKIFHLAEVLKNITHSTYGLNIPFDFFENVKDTPCFDLYNRTPRECYIQMSEHYIKPLYGNSFFIKKAVETIKSSHDDIWIVPDCGFNEEAKYLSSIDGVKCFYIILSRDGKTFDNDSREYIKLENICDRDSYINVVNTENNIEMTGLTIYNNISKWLELDKEI